MQVKPEADATWMNAGAGSPGGLFVVFFCAFMFSALKSSRELSPDVVTDLLLLQHVLHDESVLTNN